MQMCLYGSKAEGNTYFHHTQLWPWEEGDPDEVHDLFNPLISFGLVCVGRSCCSWNQISKTNQPYDAQTCWLLLFFPLRFIGIFSLLPSFPPEVVAFSPRGSLWTGPDVPGSTLPHSLPHRIFMGNQAPQSSTAQQRATQTRDHLFIYFTTLLPG